jgi:hypothetical protein
VVEVPVAGVQHEVVLQSQRRQPHVVGRNGGALPAKLLEHRGIVVGRLVVGEDDSDTGLEQESPQCPLVVGLAAAVGKP